MTSAIAVSLKRTATHVLVVCSNLVRYILQKNMSVFLYHDASYMWLLCQQVFHKHTDSSHSNNIDKTHWSCCSRPQDEDVSLLTVSQTVLTKHIEVAALGHKMWQFINCFQLTVTLFLFT